MTAIGPNRPSALVAAALAVTFALPAYSGAAPSTGTLSLHTGAIGAPVLIDGQAVGTAPLPGPWTLSVGQHTIEVRPPNASAEKVTVSIVAGQEAEVELLKQAATVPAEAALEGPRERIVHTGPGFSLATAGYITAGVGLAAGVTASLFGLSANKKASDARGLDKADPASARTDQLALVRDADRAALICNVGLGVGGVLLLSGVSMVLLASDGPIGALSLAPAPTGFSVGGTF